MRRTDTTRQQMPRYAQRRAANTQSVDRAYCEREQCIVSYRHIPLICLRYVAHV